MAQSQPKLGRLEPFYGWYKQVIANGRADQTIIEHYDENLQTFITWNFICIITWTWLLY